MKVPQHEFDETSAAWDSGRDHPLHPDLKAWLDGELTVARAWFVHAHLWFCPACREEVTWLKRLGEDMRDLEQAVPSPRLRARILAALPDTPPGRPAIFPTPSTRITRFVVAGAIACLGIAVLAAAAKYGRPFYAQHTHTPTLATSPGSSSATGQLRRSDGAPPPHVVISTAPDPHTTAADKMLANWEQREARQLHNNQMNWAKLVAAIHAIPAGRRVDEPLQLTLAVPDVNDAEYRLAAWGTSVGASVSAPTHPQPLATAVAPLVTTVEPVYRPSGATTFAPEPIVTIRVPLAKIASLEPILKQIGAWNSTNAAVSRTIEKSGASQRPAPGAKPGPKGIHPVESAADANEAPTNIAAARPGAPDQTVSRDAPPPSVTLRIHLTSLEAVLQNP